MWRDSAGKSGWQGVVLVAISYAYFLIFAQFAFLNRLGELGFEGAHLKAVMGAMALGGIFFSLLTPRVGRWTSAEMRLCAGFMASAAATFLTLAHLSLTACVIDAFVIGAALALLTVTLASNLRHWMGNRNLLFKIGLGTGIGYLVCKFSIRQC